MHYKIVLGLSRRRSVLQQLDRSAHPLLVFARVGRVPVQQSVEKAHVILNYSSVLPMSTATRQSPCSFFLQMVT